MTHLSADVAPNHAIDAEQRFLTFAAHELNGEIALQLALAEATLAHPNADTAALRKMGEGVVAACQRQARLLEALLTLARSEYGDLRREPVDLAATTVRVLRAHEPHGLRKVAALEPAGTTGDSHLVERLVTNLVTNAIRHNLPGGQLKIRTYTAAGRATFTIANTGPVIPPGELRRLFQPFQRLRVHARPCADGAGLGLAIVHAIAIAHDATVRVQAAPSGGLAVNVAFPAPERNRTPCATTVVSQ